MFSNGQFEHWAVSEEWQTLVKDKWEQDNSVLVGVGMVIRTTMCTKRIFDIAAGNLLKLSPKAREKEIEKAKAWIHDNLTTKQGKILYLDKIWDSPYPHPFHDDTNVKQQGMWFEFLLIV